MKFVIAVSTIALVASVAVALRNSGWSTGMAV